jgi:hypothetical protein
MKTLTTLFALAILCAAASAQTIKSLGYDTASGEVVANTGTNVLTFTNEANFTSIRVGGDAIIDDGGKVLWDTNQLVELETFTISQAPDFEGTAAAITRTNLGLPLPALTNTSNADMLSALGAVQTIFKLKTSTTLYDTNELVADPDLFFVAEANKNYAVTLFIFSPTDPASSNFAAQITQTGDADIIGAWTKSAAADAFQPTGALVTERSEIFFPDDIPSGWAQHFTVIGGNSNSTITLNIAADDEARIGAGSYLKAEVIQ